MEDFKRLDLIRLVYDFSNACRKETYFEVGGDDGLYKAAVADRKKAEKKLNQFINDL